MSCIDVSQLSPYKDPVLGNGMKLVSKFNFRLGLRIMFCASIYNVRFCFSQVFSYNINFKSFFKERLDAVLKLC